jgi:stage III sporulation protein AG
MNESIKKLLNNKWLLTITAVGILLLAFGVNFGGGSSPSPPTATSSANGSQVPTASDEPSALTTEKAYQRMYEQELSQAINQISGISNAVVYVFVKSTPVQSFAMNQQTSSTSTTQKGAGGSADTRTTSTTSSIVSEPMASGSSQPVIVSQQMPSVTGVLVLAKAKDPVQMEAIVTGAVQDVLGIPSFEITVLPRN